MNTKQRWELLAPEYIEALRKKGKGDYLRYRLLTPHLMRILGPLKGRAVLDIGCGDGHLARRMALKGARVWAFDWMEPLIARGLEEERRRALGITYTVADASERFPFPPIFNLVVANMVLKDMRRIQTTVGEVYRVLCHGGRFVLSILHPCFSMNVSQWQARRTITGKSRKVTFEIEAPYTSCLSFLKTVSGSRAEIVHFHRPLSYYVQLLRKSGFLFSGLWEPVLRPGSHCPDRYYYATLIPPFLIMEGEKP